MSEKKLAGYRETIYSYLLLCWNFVRIG